MPKMTYAENPVHPVLNDFPSALVPTSIAFDMLHLVTRRPTFRNASFFSLLFALLTGIPAAISGLRDYEEIPEGSDAKRIANAHAVLNLGVLGAVGLGLFLRMFGKVGVFARFLNVASGGALLVSGWYGTHLVYRHGMRVHAVDPLAGAPDLGADTGKPYADRLEAFAHTLPASDLRALATQAGDTVGTAAAQAQATLQDAASTIQARAAEVRSTVEGATSGSDELDDALAADAEADALLDVAATTRTKIDEA